MDMSTGKMLNDFKGATISSYRCRSCFGHGEASVVCGDEEGRVWAWDLLDVSISPALFLSTLTPRRWYRPLPSSRTRRHGSMINLSLGSNITPLRRMSLSPQGPMGP